MPTIAGATVGLLSEPSTAELLAVGLLGLTATFGVFLYELQNSQLYAAVLQRAVALERRMGLRSAREETAPGGAFSERPTTGLRLFGLLGVGHGRGLAVVYGAALAGWSYLFVWGLLALLGAGNPRAWGAAVGILAGLLLIGETHRLDSSGQEAPDSEGETTLLRPSAPSARE